MKRWVGGWVGGVGGVGETSRTQFVGALGPPIIKPRHRGGFHRAHDHPPVIYLVLLLLPFLSFSEEKSFVLGRRGKGWVGG